MLPRYTVFGNPIAHSQSPQIHQLFAAQEGATLEYTRTLVPDAANGFQAALNQFFAHGGNGANITLPYKQQAHNLAHQHTARAQAAGAVNTLHRQADGTLLGDNTDGIGLVRDLTEQLGINLAGKHILLLGAGGAARGVILPLADCQPASITIANRTHAKAQQLAQQFAIQAAEYHQLTQPYDIIINATSSSVTRSIPAIPDNCFSDCQLAYDMFYAARPTPFLAHAAQHGAAQTADGLGMLVGQAAAAYQLWRSYTPNIAPVIATLRAELAA